jgi:hypothetical protein
MILIEHYLLLFILTYGRAVIDAHLLDTLPQCSQFLLVYEAENVSIAAATVVFLMRLLLL